MSMTDPSSSFPAGMPPSYARNHSREERAAHAQIIIGRGRALVHIETCLGPTVPGTLDTQWLCVVTDDRPGLLSLLSAAICAHGLDIQSARIYCRSRPGQPDEAVDLLGVRGPAGRVSAVREKVASIRATIESVLRGEISMASLQRSAAPTARPGRLPPVSVWFDGSGDVLIVEARDRPGLLLAISLAIFRERLTIVRSHVSTVATSARDEFELAEIDGRRLSGAVRSAIVEKVRAALEENERKEDARARRAAVP